MKRSLDQILRVAMFVAVGIALSCLFQLTSPNAAQAAEPQTYTKFETTFNEPNELNSFAISGDGQHRAYIRTNGAVMYSKNNGVTYNNILDEVKGPNTRVAISNDGNQIFVAYSNLSIANPNSWTYDSDKFDHVILKVSSDRGETWRNLYNSKFSDFLGGPFTSLTISNDGTSLAMATSIGTTSLVDGYTYNNATHKLYVSRDSGTTWSQVQSRTEAHIKFDSQLVASADGSKLAWTTPQGTTLISSDSGLTWSNSGIYAQSLGMSSNGQHLAISYSKYWANSSGQHLDQLLYTSHDGGATFALTMDVAATLATMLRTGTIGPIGLAVEIHWLDISDNGQIIFFETTDGYIGRPAHLFYSTDSGVSIRRALYPINGENGGIISSTWDGITLSSNGNVLILNDGGTLYAAPLPVPAAPATINATVANSQATVTWSLPTSGLALTDYVLQYSPDNGYTWRNSVHTASASATSATITGLSNGTAYLFRVSGVNNWGFGNFATTQTLLTPGFTPWSPQNLVVASSDESLYLTWQEPRWNGDSPIRGYQVEYSTSFSGPWIKFPSNGLSNSPVSITGLTNGTTYFVKVTPINDVGSGYTTRNASYRPAIPMTYPGKPSSPTATYSGAVINLAWSAPSNNGGSAITDYVYEYSSDNGTSWSEFTHTASTSTNVSISGLPIGYTYIFRVSAKNIVGVGAKSDSSAPAAVAPTAPTAPTVMYGDTTVSLSWTAPNTGGASITDYLIQYSGNGGNSWSTFSHSASSETLATINSLTNGTSYLFRIAAINIVGTSATSTNSVAAVPSGIPETPTSVIATASSNTVALSWTAPAANGAAITDYLIEYSTDAGTNWSTYSHSASTTTSATINGLTNYVSYIFRVSAVNKNGASAASVQTTSVNPGSTAASIALTRDAVGSKTGAAFTTQPQITLRDLSSATITTDNSTVVTATVSAGGVLIGSKQETATAGIVTFVNLGLSGVNGTSYTITFSAGGFTATQSIAATTGDAKKLILTTSGVGGASGVEFNIQPIVKIQDSAGNIITTDSSSTVTVTTETAGCYTAEAAKVATSGIAQFTNFKMSGTEGTTCLISYESPGLTSSTQSVVLSRGPPGSLTKTQRGDGATYGRAMPIQPIWEIRDGGVGTNVMTTDNSSVVTVTVINGSTYNPISGAVVLQETATAVAGIVTFTHLGFSNIPLGNTTYKLSINGTSISATDTVILGKGDPVLSWSNQSVKWGETATVLAPISNTAGTFSYSSASTGVIALSGTGNSIATPGSVGDSVITATFTPMDTTNYNSGVTTTMTMTALQSYLITTTSDSNSAITANTNALSGSSPTITFQPATGYSITGVSVDGTALSGEVLDLAVTNLSYTFSNIAAVHSISVSTTIKSYTVAAINSNNGTLTNSGSSSVTHGENSLSYSVAAGTGYQVGAIWIDATLLTSSTTPTLANVVANGFTFMGVSTDHEFEVVFIPTTSGKYLISTIPDTRSSITSSISVPSGETQRVTFASKPGYRITGVIVDSVPLTGSALTAALKTYSVTFTNVTSAHTVEVTTTIISYTITATSGSNGSISSAGTTAVTYGASSPTYVFTPTSGYQIATISIDGGPLTTTTSPTLAVAKTNGYQFTSVATDHLIAVTYEAIPVTALPVAGGGGGGGGGGGAPKQTALYFQVVDSSDVTKIYTKSVCVEIYSRTLFPQFMGTGCSGADGRINVLVGDAKVSIRVFELGNGAVYREYLGEVANDIFTLDGGTLFAETTRYAISLPGAKIEPVTPAPTPTPSPTPTPTPSPSANVKFYQVTKTNALITKVVLKTSRLSVSLKLGKAIQVSLISIGKKSATVVTTVKNSKNQVFKVNSSKILKNKSYTTPGIKFTKIGTYKILISVGSIQKAVTVKISSLKGSTLPKKA